MRDFIQRNLIAYRIVISTGYLALIVAIEPYDWLGGFFIFNAGFALLGAVQDRIISDKTRQNLIVSQYLWPIYLYYGFRWFWRGCPRIDWEKLTS
jgi:hypothetical protein